MIKRIQVLLLVLLLVLSSNSSRAEQKSVCDFRLPPDIYYGNFPPYNYTMDGKPEGFSVLVVLEMMQRLGIEAEPKNIPWTRSYQYAQKQPNTALFSVSRLPSRIPLFNWVGPIMSFETSLVGLKGRLPDMTSLEEAKAVKTILVAQSGSSDILLTKKGFVNLHRLSKNNNIIGMLFKNRADLAAVGMLHAKFDAVNQGLDPARLKKYYTFAYNSLYIVFSRDVCSETLEKWQSVLDEIKRDGTYDRIMDDFQIQIENRLPSPQ